MFHLSILVYVIILDKKYSWKISTEDEFEKNKLCRSALGSSARQGLSDPTNIVALTQIFVTFIKKWYTLQKTGKENITSFQTGPSLLFILKVTNPFNIETHHM